MKTMMLDDAELVRCFARQHSQEAFAEIVRRHLGLVYSSALRRLGGDTHGAEDVAQRVFIALAQAAPKLAEHTSLTAWLYTTTRNLALNAGRGGVRRQTREQAVLATCAVMSGEDREPDWEALRPELDATLDELDETDRSALLGRFFEERTYAQIAAVLAVQEDAARMRVNRALDKLRDLLARRGITSTSAALGGLLAQRAMGAVPASLAGRIGMAVQGLPNGSVVGSGTSLLTISGVALGVLLMGGLAVGWWWDNQTASGLRLDLEQARTESSRLQREVAQFETKLRRAEGDLLALEKIVEGYVAEEAKRRALAVAKPAVAEELMEVSINGQIRYPGRQRVTPGTSVGQVVAKAGGVTPIGNRKKVVVTRFGAKGAKTVFTIDLDRTIETDDGVKLPAMILQPGDIIYVSDGLP